MNMLDDVNGQIIGGDFLAGRLYYDNRIQSGNIYGESLDDLMQQSKEIKQKLINEYSHIGLYKNPDLWELRF